MDDITSLAGPVATIIGTAAPAIKSFTTPTPKTQKLKLPAVTPTPTMPTPDDDKSRAAALQTIAKRATQHGRNSTDLSKESLG